MTKFNGILIVLALAFTVTACGYEGPDTDETQEGIPTKDEPKKDDGIGGGVGTVYADGGGGGTPGVDSGTDAGSGGSPPVSTDAGSGGSDAGGSDAGPASVVQPDPVIVTGACQVKFSNVYVGGSATAEIRGNLPGATWSSGPTITDTNADKYLEYSPVSIGAGMYDITYMVPPSTWANMGDATTLKAMTPAAREFILCNWWDAGAGKVVSVASPSCNVRIMVGGGCTITPYGNMKDFK